MIRFITILITFTFALPSQSGIIEMNGFNLENILLEDSNRQPGTAQRYAYAYEVDINFFDFATAEILNNGDTLWRLRLKSENAFGMKVHFSDFYIPNHSSLTFSSSDQTMSDGPFTSANNHPDGQFGHALIKGEDLILEYL